MGVKASGARWRTKPGTPLVERFWAKVLVPLSSEGVPTDDSCGCWLFLGSRTSSLYGYGSIREDSAGGVRGKLIKVHRLSFLLHHGDIPEGWDVCHACDVVICVNPNHLFCAPHRENMRDYIGRYGALGVRKGRFPGHLSPSLTASLMRDLFPYFLQVSQGEVASAVLPFEWG